MNYEPTYQDPARELEVCLNFYRALLDELREYDDMEVAAHLCYRDGIAWALEQLDNRVDQRIQQEVEHLDRRLRAERDYLIRTLDVYGDMVRHAPRSHWWWYLDELPAESEGGSEIAEYVAESPAHALADKSADYEDNQTT
jgi:hypothetical protein